VLEVRNSHCSFQVPTLSFMAFAEEEQNLLEKLLGAGCMGALLELRGWCYHRNDGTRQAVWMYLVFSVRPASSFLYFYNIQHSN